MPEDARRPEHVPMERARAELTARVRDAAHAGRRSVLTDNGRPVAALVSVHDLALLRFLDDLKLRAEVKAVFDARGLSCGALEPPLFGPRD